MAIPLGRQAFEHEQNEPVASQKTVTEFYAKDKIQSFRQTGILKTFTRHYEFVSSQ